MELLWTIPNLGRYEMIERIRLFLAGKKTYLVAIGGIIAALINFSEAGDVGMLILTIMSALGLSGIHAQNSRK